MTLRTIAAMLGLALLAPFPLHAQAWAPAGEAYAITRSYKTADHGSDGASGTSSGHESWLERVIARRADGIELEYDLPADAKPEERARSWQFPVRVLRAPDGRLRLLNAGQMEERLSAWLDAAKWDRSACGRLIFTWTAFRVECDPQAILPRLEQLNVAGQELRDGAPYRAAGALGEGRLLRDGAGGRIFHTVLEVDPDTIRRERAQADVAVGELTGKPVSLEAAMQARSKEAVSGSMAVVWNADEARGAWTRTTTTILKVARADGVVENRTATDTVERRRLAE